MTEPIEKEIGEIIDQLSQHLPDDIVTEARSLNGHREWGISLEYLCAKLDELEIKVPIATAKKIFAVGRYMNLDPKNWELLQIDDNHQ